MKGINTYLLEEDLKSLSIRAESIKLAKSLGIKTIPFWLDECGPESGNSLVCLTENQIKAINRLDDMAKMIGEEGFDE